MSGRYETEGNPQARWEPGSDGRVLANALGVTDPAEMSAIELDLLIRLHERIGG
jgi:cell filamentation protein